MNLIRPNILDKFAKSIDKKAIYTAYQSFLRYQEKQEAIKTFKEIEYQEGFFRDLFVDCLGYRLKTDYPDDFSLSREATNAYDGKHADGAIWVNGKIKAVIELKDTSIRDLTRPRSRGKLDAVSQAFNYKNSYKDCKYAIVSNFSEIRVYWNTKLEYIGFDLFSLDREGFGWLYSLLNHKAIRQDVILDYINSIKKQEEKISAKFYKDLASIRIALIDEASRVSNLDRSILVEKIQKYIDRIVFICFAEDKGLIPQNTLEKYIDNGSKWFKSKNRSLLHLFEDINEGNSYNRINKFNGGLFSFDESIDEFNFSDELIERIKSLSKYDFESELTVNVLGHIFEQSLNDLEKLKSPGGPTEAGGERKKFGIFYTPEHITRYICENTIGSVCAKKKKELGIDYIDVFDAPVRRGNNKPNKILSKLYDYKDFLTNLKIIDPACGSGAFLNMAFDIIKREYQYFDRFRRLIEGDALGLYDIDIAILENNLYGVDISQESVDIARLSLWLKTASPHRMLSDLSSKIKQGDSLKINFDEYFPEVKKKGGFDIVIGNPPYVRYTKLDNDIIEYIQREFVTAYKQFDLYVPFNELALRIVRHNGYIGFIQPNKFLGADYGAMLLHYLKENADILSIKNVALENVFFDASAYPYLFIFRKKSAPLQVNFQRSYRLNIFRDFNDVEFENFDIDIGLARNIIEKIEHKSIKITDLYNVKRGIPASKFLYSDYGGYLAIKSSDLDSSYFNTSEYHLIAYKNADYGREKNLEFCQRKILLPRTVKTIRAVLDEEHHVLDRIYYLLPKASIDDFIMYTHLGVLNSYLMNLYYMFYFMTTTIGGGYFDLKGTQIKSLFLPSVNISDVSDTVQDILQTKEYTLENNIKINELLMSYYNLSPREKKYILELNEC